MKLIKTTLAFVVTAAISSGVVHAAETTLSGGTINFTGQVVDGACAVSADSLNQTVALDQVRASRLQTAGQAAGQAKSFNITLEDCDTTAWSNVAVTFNGQSDANTVGALANTAGAGAATNVALQLYGQDGNAMTLGTAGNAATMTTGENILPFSVDYVATAGAATAGGVAAVATFTTTYS
ncbi:fimbrial protein [Enterobacter ludwigii]|jgi:P pilus assembly protein, pilin FimA|uniref:fimbrial protein n=1 Tax=Enterobacter cloacae TaxID=550 RepID=UPI00101AF690|nr:fimbrial protein [Enterobacter cloacae]MCF8582424.1 fimbrial protein [Enterobacter ludwigii]QBC03411.1 fimbrial protein [Enterobacter cloacae]